MAGWEVIHAPWGLVSWHATQAIISVTDYTPRKKSVNADIFQPMQHTFSRQFYINGIYRLYKVAQLSHKYLPLLLFPFLVKWAICFKGVMKTPERWRASRIEPSLSVFLPKDSNEAMTSYRDIILGQYVEWFGRQSANRHTDGRTGPILYPRPLREGISETIFHMTVIIVYDRFAGTWFVNWLCTYTCYCHVLE